MKKSDNYMIFKRSYVDFLFNVHNNRSLFIMPIKQRSQRSQPHDLIHSDISLKYVENKAIFGEMFDKRLLFLMGLTNTLYIFSKHYFI